MPEIQIKSQIMSEEKTEPIPLLTPRRAAWLLSALVILLVLFGLTMLYSTSSGTSGASLLKKQTLWAIAGFVGSFIIYAVGYRRILRFWPLITILAAILLLVARAGRPINDAYRWIKLPGGMSLQPSEFAKLAVVIFLAEYCTVYHRAMNSRRILPALGLVVLMGGLVLMGKDLGTTILLFATAALMLFVSGLKIRWFFLLPPFVPFSILLLKMFDKERWSRLTSFLSPETFQKDDSYQLWTSLLALGSGSWFGRGFTESRMKARYLPEAHTDFILSIVGEELGFLAMAGVIFVYASITLLCVYIAVKSRDRQGMLLGFGVSALISMQAIINIGVISGALPTKGIPAPFISYGGSNMLMCFSALGLMLSIASCASGDDEPGLSYFTSFRVKPPPRDGEEKRIQLPRTRK